MRLGRRLYSTEERTRTAIGSMVNGTIGGDSKIGMPIVEVVRRPLVPSGGVFLAYSTDFQIGEGDGSWAFGDYAQNTTTTIETAPGADQYVNVTAPGSYLVEVHIELTKFADVGAGDCTFSIDLDFTTSYDSDSQPEANAHTFDLSATVPVSTVPATISVSYSLPSVYSINEPVSFIRITE